MIRRSEITWDPAPVLGEAPEVILWYGTTPTGERVYRRYRQETPLYDAVYHYEVDEVEP